MTTGEWVFVSTQIVSNDDFAMNGITVENCALKNNQNNVDVKAVNAALFSGVAVGTRIAGSRKLLAIGERVEGELKSGDLTPVAIATAIGVCNQLGADHTSIQIPLNWTIDYE